MYCMMPWGMRLAASSRHGLVCSSASSQLPRLCAGFLSRCCHCCCCRLRLLQAQPLQRTRCMPHSLRCHAATSSWCRCCSSWLRWAMLLLLQACLLLQLSHPLVLTHVRRASYCRWCSRCTSPSHGSSGSGAGLLHPGALQQQPCCLLPV